MSIATASQKPTTSSHARGAVTPRAGLTTKPNWQGSRGGSAGCNGWSRTTRTVPDIVVQIASASRARQQVAVRLLNGHRYQCVVAAARTSDIKGEQNMDEMAATIRQVLRL
jgi:hypothetical protein